MIKLHEYYSFGKMTDCEKNDYSGVWQTVGYEMKEGKEVWTLKRIATFNQESIIDAKIKLQEAVIRHLGKSISKDFIRDCLKGRFHEG